MKPGEDRMDEEREKTYALKSVNFSVMPGERVLIVGRTGESTDGTIGDSRDLRLPVHNNKKHMNNNNNKLIFEIGSLLLLGWSYCKVD